MKNEDHEQRFSEYFNALQPGRGLFPINERLEKYSLLHKALQTQDEKLKDRFNAIVSGRQRNLFADVSQAPANVFSQAKGTELAVSEPLINSYDHLVKTLQAQGQKLTDDNVRLADVIQLLVDDNSNLRKHIRSSEVLVVELLDFYSSVTRLEDTQSQRLRLKGDGTA